MLNPDQPDEVVVLTTERPLPGRVWLWRGKVRTLEWRRERLMLEFPLVEGDPNTDYGYTWLVRGEGGRYLMFYYHGKREGANAIWVTDVDI